MNTTETDQIEAREWFLEKRAEELKKWDEMPAGTKDELIAKMNAIKEFNKKDVAYEKALSANTATASVETTDYVVKNKAPQQQQQNKPVFYVNPDVSKAIDEYRSENQELNNKVKAMTRADLEDEYILKLMKREGYEPGINVKEDIDKFKDDFPSLAKRAEVMPKERLENDYVLSHMRKNGFDPDVQKYKNFLNKPENAGLKKEAENLVAGIRNPQVRERVMYREKAPQVLKAHGMKL